MSEMTQMVAETAERLLADHVSTDLLRTAEQGTWPAELWQALEENGLTQPMAAEEHGGIGAGWAEAFAIAHAAGYDAAPVPLAETIVAGWLLSQAGISVPEGLLTLIDDGHDLSRDGSAVSGKACAPWGNQAAHAVAVFDEGGTWQAGVIDISDAACAPDLSLAHEPRDHLTLEAAGAEVASLPITGGPSPARLAGAAIRSAQMAGGLRRAVELGVQYATERQQFGRPIAKFQAIQQMLAVAAAKAAEARMAAEYACLALDRAGGDIAAAAFDIAAAKIVTGEAVETINDVVHEVHGAIGFTEEHHLHFTTRRLWTWRGEFGAETFWSTYLGQRVLQRGADNLWPDLTERQSS